MLKSIYAHFDEHVETYLATVALTVFSTLVILQVIMRYVFNSPLVWSEEIARYALVWFVYLSGSYAVKYQKHVKFNVIIELIGKKIPLIQRIVRVAVFALWLAFLVFMLRLSIEMVSRQFISGQLAPGSQIPMYLVYLGLPIGFLLMSFRVLQHTVGSIVDLVKNPLAPIPQTPTEVD